MFQRKDLAVALVFAFLQQALDCFFAKDPCTNMTKVARKNCKSSKQQPEIQESHFRSSKYSLNILGSRIPETIILLQQE